MLDAPEHTPGNRSLFSQLEDLLLDSAGPPVPPVCWVKLFNAAVLSCEAEPPEDLPLAASSMTERHARAALWICLRLFARLQGERSDISGFLGFFPLARIHGAVLPKAMAAMALLFETPEEAAAHRDAFLVFSRLESDRNNRLIRSFTAKAGETAADQDPPEGEARMVDIPALHEGLHRLSEGLFTTILASDLKGQDIAIFTGQFSILVNLREAQHHLVCDTPQSPKSLRREMVATCLLGFLEAITSTPEAPSDGTGSAPDRFLRRLRAASEESASIDQGLEDLRDYMRALRSTPEADHARIAGGKPIPRDFRIIETALRRLLQ